MTTPTTGISSMATRALLAELAAAYAQGVGAPVRVESVGGVDAAKRVQAGEPFDFAVLAADAIDQLAAGGHVLADSKVDLANSLVAVAVRHGQARPDISSQDAVKRAVLSARSIGYSTGPSGVALIKLFERWGIAGEIGNRLVQAQPGVPVAALLARGDVALGFQQLSELLNVEGVDVVGALPAAIQIKTTFSAAICRAARQAAAALQFLQYIASPQAAAVKRRHGMDPA